MFKNLFSLFLLVFFIALVGNTYAVTDFNLPKKLNTETDSLSVNEDKSALISKKINTASITSTAEDSEVGFWQSEEEVEDDSTANSALSFNFIYYVIEKFKFQVE